MTLEQQAQKSALLHLSIERDTQTLSRNLSDLYFAFQLERPITGFYSWIETFGIPRGTAHRYINVGMALKAGLPAELPVMTLAVAGSAIRAGAPIADVRHAAQQDTVRDYADAHHHAGTVGIRLALPAKGVWDAQTTRWQALTDLPKLETQALMITALQFVTDDDVLTIARSGEI